MTTIQTPAAAAAIPTISIDPAVAEAMTADAAIEEAIVAAELEADAAAHEDLESVLDMTATRRPFIAGMAALEAHVFGTVSAIDIPDEDFEIPEDDLESIEAMLAADYAFRTAAHRILNGLLFVPSTRWPITVLLAGYAAFGDARFGYKGRTQ